MKLIITKFVFFIFIGVYDNDFFKYGKARL